VLCLIHDDSNGASIFVGARMAGQVNFLRVHLRVALDAIQAGVNLQGYYVWSLMDNFE
jgi:beta-glucosidase